MPFVPHTRNDIQTMLAEIGVSSIAALFDEIPKELKQADFKAIPEALSEMEITRLMMERAKQDEGGPCFLGGGAYEHHVPAAILDIISRGEYLTAYTPYQAEASQGTLQLIYEYQTMMANLMGMEVSNASLYDGASALAEAVLMAVRAHRNSKSKKILIPVAVNPIYRNVVRTIVHNQQIVLEELPFCREAGSTIMEPLEKYKNEDITALIIPQPNYFGILEDVDVLTDWAHKHNILVIAIVNPIAMALLKEPGSWGEQGADIVCGEGQPLGVPLASGGPYFGFMCCKKQFARQMPGRIVGRTRDQEGKEGFTLTLQAREQHIRRSKATSNICTNQGLMVTAATIYMSLLGAEGLRRVAAASHENAINLMQKLTAIEGVHQVFHRPFFHEFILRLERPVSKVLEQLADCGIQGGISLADNYPELENSLLVCVTETKTEVDLQLYAKKLQQIFAVEKV